MTYKPNAEIEQTGEIEIPPDIRVACPMFQFALRRAVKCEQCPHFHGLLDRFPGNRTFRFDQKYQVRCAGPVVEIMSRNLVRVDMTDE